MSSSPSKKVPSEKAEKKDRKSEIEAELTATYARYSKELNLGKKALALQSIDRLLDEWNSLKKKPKSKPNETQEAGKSDDAGTG